MFLLVWLKSNVYLRLGQNNLKITLSHICADFDTKLYVPTLNVAPHRSTCPEGPHCPAPRAELRR